MLGKLTTFSEAELGTLFCVAYIILKILYCGMYTIP